MRGCDYCAEDRSIHRCPKCQPLPEPGPVDCAYCGDSPTVEDRQLGEDLIVRAQWRVECDCGSCGPWLDNGSASAVREWNDTQEIIMAAVRARNAARAS